MNSISLNRHGMQNQESLILRDYATFACDSAPTTELEELRMKLEMEKSGTINELHLGYGKQIADMAASYE